MTFETRLVRVSTVGLFLIALCGALYFASDFLLPVTLSFLFALVLSPVARWLHRKGLPEGFGAIILVAGLTAGLATSMYFLSGPVSDWVQKAPEAIADVRMKLYHVSGPMDAVQDATEQVEEMTSEDKPGVQTVVVREPGLMSKAASGAPNILAKIVLTLVLLFFLLASGDMFYEKLVAVMPTFSDKKRAVRIARDVEREVSRYLLTITIINAGLGLCIWATMFALGVPNPVLWGIIGAILNFIPYIGSLMGVALVALVSLATFESVEYALLPPLAYLCLTALEGQFLTPTIVGRRLELNAVAIFIAVAFWGWLWGIVGALIAVPFLVTIKIFCDHVEALSALGQFLSARHVSPLHEDEDDPPGVVSRRGAPAE
ncbi:transport protein [Lutibaculum baratangense AMV1]|uniref:Transport protein n=1 Tax=Lutibaculum baratangense AMV1 TaxID=631454 RepID=V4RD78_9HYPH|nr:transport protein [Lutibaculum baratangense AMV1]